MDATTISKLKELIGQGEKLVPDGGHEFSGYNAKMQSQYLMWRKNCLDIISKIGEKGVPLRTRITNDENSPYFYQSSAQTVLTAIKDALEIAEAEAPAPAETPAPPKPAPEPKVTKPTPEPPAPKPAPEPPVKKTAPVPPKPEPVKEVAEKEEVEKPSPKSKPVEASEAEGSNNAFVVSSSKSPLLPQLIQFLREIGINALIYQRTTGSSEKLLEFVRKSPTTRYALVMLMPDDIPSLMYEIGYLVGKLGVDRVSCIYQKDMQIPKNIPGVQFLEVVVKMEEVSLSLYKSFKSAGYSVTI